MYLTGGQYKGFRIDVAKSAKPTLSKVRESIFNILIQFETKEKKFLDMFAGSGIMGLEAASRGYKVKELEINKKSALIIKKNYEKLKLRADITICDALGYKGEEKFNIIYLDPPWEADYAPIILKAYNLLEKEGLIIIEHDFKKNLEIENLFDKENINLNVVKSKKYGRCLIDILQKY